MEIGTVRQVDIDHEMQGAYLDYAMSVIVSRALPDVRDGLKPVQRRILYAMHDMGLASDKPFKKSARIVGEVLGKYHPHGDSAVYETMARMAQDFSLRYMLVDGQGNFGSIDGDSPAAMRYTEARLSAVAEEILLDLDKDTVDWVPNFDSTLTEPSVLPALVPNLLVNGTSGIAVGMTTNIPPHNLGEVVDALVYLIDRYGSLDDVTVEDLTQFIQGPDFPTGGVVYRYAEEGNGDRIDLIRNAYALGKGHLTVQAHVFIEEMTRNRSRIVITELPYQVNKTRLIERIAELVRDGKLDGVADLRDESDRQGMRICIELTRTVEARDVLSQLFKLTPMQTTFGLHMLALVDGEPRLLPLKRVLVLYLEHRQEIVTRRSRYLLEKARARAHILEGLLKALDHIDEVVRIIRSSQTTDTARKNLIDRLKLTEIQAEAILEMPLKRLVALERRKIADEYKEKLAEIKHLTDLLKSPARLRGVIRDELLALKAKYGDARRTRIADRERGHHTARDLVQAQDVVLTLWQDGQLSLTASPPAGPFKVAPLTYARANTRDDAIVFTASGKAALVPLHQVPEGQSVPASSVTQLGPAEKPVGLIVNRESVPEPGAQGEAEAAGTGASFVVLVTRLGRIKRVAREDLVAGAGRGPAVVIGLDDGDELSWVESTDGTQEVVLVTRQAQAIRFSEAEVRPMGLPAAGVLAVKLEQDDAVVGGGLFRPGAFVVTFTDAGYAKRTVGELFPLQKRYGSGVQASRCTARTGLLAVAALAAEEQDLALVTAKGKIFAIAVRDLQPAGRAVSGSNTPQGGTVPYLEPDKHGVPVRLAVLEGTKGKRLPPSQGKRSATDGKASKPGELKPPRSPATAKADATTTAGPKPRAVKSSAPKREPEAATAAKPVKGAAGPSARSATPKGSKSTAKVAKAKPARDTKVPAGTSKGASPRASRAADAATGSAGPARKAPPAKQPAPAATKMGSARKRPEVPAQDKRAGAGRAKRNQATQIPLPLEPDEKSPKKRPTSRRPKTP
ncbi:MAG TPA: DNA topoisomerase 4 subunit A [Anaerolineae bacterium]|nr:DNA topoisomerase 4 subunit A [Anaerolineae bacterium]